MQRNKTSRTRNCSFARTADATPPAIGWSSAARRRILDDMRARERLRSVIAVVVLAGLTVSVSGCAVAAGAAAGAGAGYFAGRAGAEDKSNEKD